MLGYMRMLPGDGIQFRPKWKCSRVHTYIQKFLFGVANKVQVQDFVGWLITEKINCVNQYMRMPVVEYFISRYNIILDEGEWHKHNILPYFV